MKFSAGKHMETTPADIGVPRGNYLEKLAGFSGNRLIKVLVGQCRTGKSTILKQWK